MKKLIITLIVLVAVPLAATSQNKAIQELADKYADRKGFTTLSLAGDMIKTMGNSTALNIKNMDISSLMSNITSITMVMSEKPDTEFSDDVKKAIASGGYSTVLLLSEDGETIRFLLAPAKPEGKKNEAPRNEFVITILGSDDNIIISIIGNYKIKQITKTGNEDEGGNQDDDTKGKK